MVSLFRHGRRRQASWSLQVVDTSSFDTMSIANSESSTSSRRRNTGFPEGFCGKRNTSLPHPDADTSPNASISQEDISVTRVISRQRRSFLAKNRRTISSGRIAPEDVAMYSDASSVAVASDSENGASPTLPSLPTIAAVTPQRRYHPRPTSNGADSLASASTGDHDDPAPKSPSEGYYRRHSRMRLSGDSTGRRRSFMERLGIHHRHHE